VARERGLLARTPWFYLQAQVVLFAAEVNVVREFRLWPQSISDPPADKQEPATDDR